MDILAFRSFYATALGNRVFNNIIRRLDIADRDLSSERILGVGYAVPYLSGVVGRAERCFAFMPARQGACIWPQADKVATALVFEEDLPLPDAAVDRILLIHALEFAENAQECLSEMWRVLAPNGTLTVVTPNRRGFWARNEHTPFGSGQPYSRGQLLDLLRQTNFSVSNIQETLYFLPSQKALARFISAGYEPLARNLLPYFGGVLICNAQKRLFQGLLAHRRQSRRVFIPALTPQMTNRKSFGSIDVVK